jgi:hypothetical protein
MRFDLYTVACLHLDTMLVYQTHIMLTVIPWHAYVHKIQYLTAFLLFMHVTGAHITYMLCALVIHMRY